MYHQVSINKDERSASCFLHNSSELCPDVWFGCVWCHVQMNATHFLWSSHLCSVHQYSNTPTFLVGGVVGLLVVLFYGGIGLVINPLNTELVPR